ncbi:DUF6602 domain-containing protein, partial [Vibrio cholerae]
FCVMRCQPLRRALGISREIVLANKIIENLLARNFTDFEFAFQQAETLYANERGELFHKLEYGEYRERVLLRLLKSILPARFDIGSGFIVNADGNVSTQCDLIIYDKNEMPTLESDYGQRFFPVEAVVGVGEVKSKITCISKLNEYLEKLSSVASIKNKIHDAVKVNELNYKFCPIDPKDGIFTFIVCAEFDFNLSTDKIVENHAVMNRVNCVLSVKDGILCRKSPQGELYPFPVHPEFNDISLHYIRADSNEMKSHFQIFTSLIRLMAETTHVYKVDITKYLP